MTSATDASLSADANFLIHRYQIVREQRKNNRRTHGFHHAFNSDEADHDSLAHPFASRGKQIYEVYYENHFTARSRTTWRGQAKHRKDFEIIKKKGQRHWDQLAELVCERLKSDAQPKDCEQQLDIGMTEDNTTLEAMPAHVSHQIGDSSASRLDTANGAQNVRRTDTCHPTLPDTPTRPTTATQITNSSVLDEDILYSDYASLTEAMKLFPPELYDLITRCDNPQTQERAAAVSIASYQPPYKNDKQSYINVAIKPEGVIRLASTLFGITIENNLQTNARYVLSSGARVTPLTIMSLSGCFRNKIRDVFGPVLAEAIAAAPAYMQEAKDGEARTNCVAISVSSNPCADATLTLYVGEYWGAKLSKELYVASPGQR